MFIVDRIEGEYAVIEVSNNKNKDLYYVDIPLICFDEEVHEGDILQITIDRKKTEECYQENKALLFKLFNKHKEEPKQVEEVVEVEDEINDYEVEDEV